MRNEYWLLRHGRSLANEAQIIVSKEDNGILEKWTLSQAGIEQAETSGRLFGEALRGQPGRTVAVYASPFSRTLKTAEVAVRAAGLDAVDVQVAEDLRERYFGSALELQPYDKAYGTIWEHDAADAHYRPGGGDGESVEAVAARLRGFFMLLESHHDGAVVLLVSHGDTLSIMQAAMTGGDVRHHRQFAFDTAELRKLPVSASTASTV